MAKGGAVWGIDIGQCALKALRCRPHEKEPRRLVVESFDYIEYPKILTQPEAEPAELIREALETFLSRNELVGDTVAMSVGGQNGLMRFIKLPPVEAKKIPDIVKYEARQQIPFSLDDVVSAYRFLLAHELGDRRGFVGQHELDELFDIMTETGLVQRRRGKTLRDPLLVPRDAVSQHEPRDDFPLDRGFEHGARTTVRSARALTRINRVFERLLEASRTETLVVCAHPPPPRLGIHAAPPPASARCIGQLTRSRVSQFLYVHVC